MQLLDSVMISVYDISNKKDVASLITIADRL